MSEFEASLLRKLQQEGYPPNEGPFNLEKAIMWLLQMYDDQMWSYFCLIAEESTFGAIERMLRSLGIVQEPILLSSTELRHKEYIFDALLLLIAIRKNQQHAPHISDVAASLEGYIDFGFHDRCNFYPQEVLIPNLDFADPSVAPADDLSFLLPRLGVIDQTMSEFLQISEESNDIAPIMMDAIRKQDTIHADALISSLYILEQLVKDMKGKAAGLKSLSNTTSKSGDFCNLEMANLETQRKWFSMNRTLMTGIERRNLEKSKSLEYN